MIMAFIQARTSSTRLAGKVLKPILGRPMLELQIERVRACKTIDRVVIVTSAAHEDQQIVELGQRIGVDVFCGNLENVLDRFYRAAERFRPDHIVRLTGDCPLIDATVVDDMVHLYLNEKCDYGTNCVPPTYPDGLDAEIFSYAVLQEAWREASLPSHLEHISLFFEEQPTRFKIANLACNSDLSTLRWTVDEPQDFEFVRAIFENLYPVKPAFGMGDVLTLLASKPELNKMNSGLMRNEGVLKSKEQDRKILAEREIT